MVKESRGRFRFVVFFVNTAHAYQLPSNSYYSAKQYFWWCLHAKMNALVSPTIGLVLLVDFQNLLRRRDIAASLTHEL